MLTTLADRSNLDGAIGSNQESKKKPAPSPEKTGYTRQPYQSVDAVESTSKPFGLGEATWHPGTFW